MITQDSISKVADAADILAVIGDVVSLKQKGSSHTGCCPFHNERTPSFHVNAAKGFYKCFGCGKAGNVFTFVMENRNFSYPEAIKYLANKFNIQLEYDSNHSVEEETESKKADKVFAIAQEYFIKNLQASKEASDYLKFTRKFNDETIALWGLGYSPKAFNGLHPKFVDDQLIDVADSTGLIKRNTTTQNTHDVYIDRITIPIRNENSRLIGYGGRLLTSDPENKFPKYINPKDSKFYHKQKTLFGLDKARKAIQKIGFATLVEGYFDVISMHVQGACNTVASCGTSFTEEQAKLLRKFTDNLLIAYDNDDAGKKATKAVLNIALPLGFRINVFPLTSFKDVDEWIQTMDPFQDDDDKKPSPVLETIEATKVDAILYEAQSLMDEAGDDAHAKNRASELIAEIVALIPKEGIREHYQKALCADLGIKPKIFKDQLKDALERRKQQVEAEERRLARQVGIPDEYKLPAEVAGKVSWLDLKKDVDNYSLFIFGNRIYSQRGGETFYFKEVSNFSIKIIQHMEDEKMPMKLAQIENVHGRKRTFDAPSEDFTSPDAFTKMLTNFGNFNWQGERTDFQRLISKLYDEMGDGRMINVLGWQDESFFAFSNAVGFTDGKYIEIDKYGCFQLNGASYYVPAGNFIYQANHNMFLAQKKVVLKHAEKPLSEYLKLVKTVHREHAMNAILFTIASVMSDLIVDKVHFFPILFLYGEPSSGKDMLIECCQAFFGKSQTALTITGRANTDKAKIRKFAQMRNMIVHMSEYKNGNDDTDLLMMGLWDRRGYERANFDSGVGTETVPILSSVVFTGNEYPVYDPLITRFIAEEMNKTEFTEQEKENYMKLSKMIEAGISSYTLELLKLRPLFEKHFREKYETNGKELKKLFADLPLKDRMIQNTAVLGAALDIASENGIELPFTKKEWMDYMLINMKRQSNKMQTGDALAKWWDCFLDACRTGKELVPGRDYRLDGPNLYINFKTVYNFYAMTHFKLFRSGGLGKSSMIDKLKKNTESFLGEIDSIRFGSAKSSAYHFNVDKLGIKGDLINIMEHIQSENNRYKRHENGNSKNQEHDNLSGEEFPEFAENNENSQTFENTPF